MDIKLITLTTAVAIASAMAQDNSDVTVVPLGQNAAPAAEASAPAPAPAPAAAPAPAPAKPAPAPVAKAAPAVDTASAAKAPEVVHGIAYNNVGNTAAAPTIRDNLDKPYKMAGSKLVYMEPTSEFSAVAFGSGNTKFISFENYNSLAMATFGLASKSLGISLSYALAKDITFTSTKDPYEKEDIDTYTVGANDILRLRLALPLGAIDVNASAFWLTYQDQTSTDTEQKDADGKSTVETDYDYWDLGATLTISNDPSAKDIFWNLGATFTRHENAYSRESKSGSSKNETETTGKDAHILIQPEFNIGSTILKSEKARVLLGLNSRAPIVFFDEFKDESNHNKDEYTTMGLYAEPNIFAELALGNCWTVFGGANYPWAVFTMESEEFTTDYNDELDIVKNSITHMRSRTGVATANIGARFQYSNFAVEASIEDTFYSNPFTGFSDANNNFIANFGAFIYF